MRGGAPILTNVVISGNKSGRGGGIYITSSSNPTLTNVAIAGNLADNQAYDVEMTINGGEDPFLDVGNRIAGKYLSEQYQIGRKAAFDNSVEAANDACSGQLNDQIRPNYPTDGTSG